MSQAMYSAQTGMSASQSKMNVVADNIANMNTVGFKQSRVDFSDIYYNTISGGSAPSANMGGINGKQIGTGVRVSSIGRDFTGGSAVTTGISTHLSIKGNGFFTVASPSNEILYTRAGNFTIDGEGYLVLPNGYKALGTASARSANGSDVPIKIPTLIQTETTPTDAAKLGNTKLSELNGNVEATSGTFDVVLTNGAATATVPVTIDKNDTVTQVINKINTALANEGTAVRAEISDNGTIEFVKHGSDQNITVNNGTSNFATAAGLTANDDGTVSSKVLDYQQKVRTGSDVTNSQKATSVDIYEDGRLEVTYANGDKLSVTTDPNDPDNIVFQYKTGSPATTIMGNDLDITGVAEPANFQLQMANFVNPNGLMGVGSNAFKQGPNSGLALYGSVSSGAFGTVNSGEYEGSNVDLAEQFTDMIQSQRMMEANSRVFNAASEIMKNLSYLGQ